MLTEVQPTLRTLVLFSSLVSCLVSSQPRAGEESLSASLPVAEVVTDSRMRRLDVMIEMGITEKGFGARRMGASEGAGAGVRAEMIIQAGRTIERFTARVVRAVKEF